MTLFQTALERRNDERAPVWFMRQAGRYHSHYQALRRAHSFMDLCRKPEIACEAALGPVRDFGFDAAILFSDLLFPLEAMGMPLEYAPGPKLGGLLRDREGLSRLQGGSALARKLDFQAQALALTRSALDPSKGLLGFVGGPWTLFAYATDGTHQNGIPSAREGLRDGRFEGFCEKLMDLLAANMAAQARAGADVVAVLDTCAGELSPEEFGARLAPALRAVLERYGAAGTGVPVLYYSRGTDARHWRSLEDLPIAAIGLDWRQDLVETLERHSDRWAVQGNVDPDWLFLPRPELEARLRDYFTRVCRLPQAKRRGWICGLGHGVKPGTPVESVRTFLQHARLRLDGEVRK